MSVFKLDPDTGDLVRENGAFVRISGVEEIVQGVRVRLRLIRGEAFMDRTLGVRYFADDNVGAGGAGAVYAKGTTLDDIGGEFRAQALAVPGVTAIENMTFEQTDSQRANREVDITFDGVISLEDQAERIPFHDKITVQLGGIGDFSG